MGKLTRTHQGVLLLGLLAVSLAVGMSAVPLAAADVTLQPPRWSVGDWWTVDCQVQDLAPMMPGAKPGWREKQSWRFIVEKEEPFDGRPHFVVAVQPIENNACPYSFRYFLRKPDLFVSRVDMIHPQGSRGRAAKAGTVTKTFTGGPAAPYAAPSFPTLPMLVPIFGARSSEAASTSLGHPAALGATSQTVEKISPSALMEKAEAALGESAGNFRLEGEAALVRITRGGTATDSQYWSAGLPWYVYGEQQEGQDLTRRYWLTDTNKE